MSPALKVTKEITFDSAHYLPNYDGKCARMHGHTYRLQVTVGIPTCHFVESNGMVLDFAWLSALLKELVEKIDHKVLNDELPYVPTAENMALRFGVDIKARLPTELYLECVRLWETPTSFAEFSPEECPCKTCECQ